MSLKFVGLALLLAVVGLFVYRDQSSTTPAVNLQPAPPAAPGAAKEDLAAALDSIERRLANLEERVHALEDFPTNRIAAGPDTDTYTDSLEARIAALEVQSRRGNGPQGYATDNRAPRRTGAVSATDGPDPYLEQLQQDFDNDVQAESALQTDLENAAPLFETEELASLTFRQVDCRANYCRLEYEDNSSNGADAMIAENELFLLLSEKYGQDIIIHGGERNGRTRSIYIELSPE